MPSRLRPSPFPHRLEVAISIWENDVATAARFASDLRRRSWRYDPDRGAVVSSTVVRYCLQTSTTGGTCVGCSRHETTRTVVARASDHPCCPDPKSVPGTDFPQQRHAYKTNPAQLCSSALCWTSRCHSQVAKESAEIPAHPKFDSQPSETSDHLSAGRH